MISARQMKRARDKAPHNQEEAAAEMGIAKSSLSGFESGRTKPRQKRVIKAMIEYVERHSD